MTELTILGGGPAGLGAAFYAHRAAKSFALYEKSPELGGMCRTFRHGEHRFDAGAHRFHDRDAEVTADVRALMGADLRPVRAPSRVWTRGRFVDFPPTPLNAVLSYGLIGGAGIATELARAWLRPTERATFADFARGRFGDTLAREFLLNYSEKLWGLPAERLSPDVATRRLQGMTLRSLLAEMLLPGAKAAHIDGEFLYPRLGYGQIVERLAEALPPQALMTGREASAFDVREGRIERVHFKDGAAAEVQGRVLSTLPLPLLVRMLGEAIAAPAREAAARLRFRQLRLVFLRVAKGRVSENASIYVPESRFCVSRVCEPKNRSDQMSPRGETALVAEVPCFPGDALDTLPAEALTRRVVDEIAQIGLARPESVVESRHFLLPYAYPVYERGYEDDVAAIREALPMIRNLDTLGRAGSFYYSHLHDQLRLAKDYVAGL